MNNTKRVVELQKQADKLGQEKRWEELILVSSEIIKLRPESTLTYVSRGIAKRNLGDFQGAIDDCSKALKIDDKHVHAYISRGMAKRELSDFQGAIDDYSKALKIDDKHVHAYISRGMAKRELSDLQGAIDDYNMALNIDDKYAIAYVGRGITKRELSDLQGAIDDYNMALNIDDKYAIAYVGRGVTKREIGDFQGAIDDFNKALTIDSSHIPAIHERGVTFALMESQKTQEETINKIKKGYEKQFADHEKQFAASQKDQEEKIKANYEKQLADHKEQLAASQIEQEAKIKEQAKERLTADHYKNEKVKHSRMFRLYNKRKYKVIDSLIIIVGIISCLLIVYLLYLVYYDNKCTDCNNWKILSFFPALAIASLFIFPFIWVIRNITHDGNRYWAMSEDAHTKWILTLEAHHPDIQKDSKLREKLLLKLFEHHGNSNTPNIILSKDIGSGKSDNINNVVRNFADKEK